MVSQQQPYQCQLCTEPCSDSFPCTDCFALYYCSTKHRNKHRRYFHEEQECSRMKQQVELREELLGPYKLVTCNVATAVASSTCQFLSSHNCHSLPPWNTQCACFNTNEYVWGTALQLSSSPLCGNQSYQAAATLKGINTPLNIPPSWDLPPTLVPCHSTLLNCTSQPRSWQEYLGARGVPQHSPAGLLLHFPLTLYQAILLANESKGGHVLKPGRTITVHYLGPQQELDFPWIFLETTTVLGATNPLHITFIGPDVPEHLHATTAITSAITKAWATAGVCGEQDCSCKNMNLALNGSGCSGLATSPSSTCTCVDATHTTCTSDHSLLTASATPALSLNGPSAPAPAPPRRSDGSDGDGGGGCGGEPDGAVRSISDDGAGCGADAGRADVDPVSVKMTFLSGCYHDLMDSLTVPDLIFGPNAGLAADPSWQVTVQCLGMPSPGLIAASASLGNTSSTVTATATPAAAGTCTGMPPSSASFAGPSNLGEGSMGVSESGSMVPQLQPPAIFTDYCEEAAWRAAQMLSVMTQRPLNVPVRLNPFRRPWPDHHHGTALPAASNGFIFGV